MKYCAFDLEIAKPIVDGANWKADRPLGISCAATLTSEGDLLQWCGQHDDLLQFCADASLPDQMTPREVQEMAGYLLEMQSKGYLILTWNGLSFDFDVLAEECQNAAWANDIANLAMEHLDMGFQMVTEKGYMIGLETCAQGLGVGAKTEGMHGDLAPIMWTGDLSLATDEQKASIAKLNEKPGSRRAQDICLAYVAQDARLTALVYEALIEQGHVYWTTRKGTRSYYPWRPRFKDGERTRLLTVNEALKTPEPDTSWMSDPRGRAEYFEWVEIIDQDTFELQARII